MNYLSADCYIHLKRKGHCHAQAMELEIYPHG